MTRLLLRRDASVPKTCSSSPPTFLPCTTASSSRTSSRFVVFLGSVCCDTLLPLVCGDSGGKLPCSEVLFFTGKQRFQSSLCCLRRGFLHHPVTQRASLVFCQVGGEKVCVPLPFDGSIGVLAQKTASWMLKHKGVSISVTQLLKYYPPSCL